HPRHPEGGPADFDFESRAQEVNLRPMSGRLRWSRVQIPPGPLSMEWSIADTRVSVLGCEPHSHDRDWTRLLLWAPSLNLGHGKPHWPLVPSAVRAPTRGKPILVRKPSLPDHR